MLLDTPSPTPPLALLTPDLCSSPSALAPRPRLSLLPPCRHLQRNPDNQLYPLFEYFENWCQDENRHGDFLAAVLKSRPELLCGWQPRCVGKGACCAVLCCAAGACLPACLFVCLLPCLSACLPAMLSRQHSRCTSLISPSLPPPFLQPVEPLLQPDCVHHNVYE